MAEDESTFVSSAEPEEQTAPDPVVDEPDVDAEPGSDQEEADEFTEPDWIGRPYTPPQAAAPPQQYQQQYQQSWADQAYSQMSPQQQARVAAMPPQQQMRVLEDFVADPNNFVRGEVERYVGPLAAEMQRQEMALRQYSRDAAVAGLPHIEASVRNHYKALSTNETFRKEKRIRDQVDGFVRGLYERAQQAAYSGDLDSFNQVQKTLSNPALGAVAIAWYQHQAGPIGRAASPAQPVGAQTETTRKRSTSEPRLPQDVYEALNKLPEGIRETKLKEARARLKTNPEWFTEE